MSASRKRDSRSLVRRRRQSARTIPSPSAIVAHEGDPSVRAHRACGRLADVVEERAESERLAAGELVRERLVEHGAHAGLGHRRRSLDQVPQDLERVVVDVEVVVAALFHAVEGGQLGQHRLEQAEPVGQGEPVEDAVGDDQALELGKDALPGGAAHPRRGGSREPLGLGVRGEAELGGEAGQAQRAQRVPLVGRRAEHPQGAGGHVGSAPERVDQLPAFARPGHGVDGEVAPGEILLDGLALQRRQVKDALLAVVDHPPGAEGLGQAEDRPLDLRGEPRERRARDRPRPRCPRRGPAGRAARHAALRRPPRRRSRHVLAADARPRARR